MYVICLCSCVTFVILHILLLHNNRIWDTSGLYTADQKTIYKEIYSRKCPDTLITGGKQALNALKKTMCAC